MRRFACSEPKIAPSDGLILTAFFSVGSYVTLSSPRWSPTASCRAGSVVSARMNGSLRSGVRTLYIENSPTISLGSTAEPAWLRCLHPRQRRRSHTGSLVPSFAYHRADRTRPFCSPPLLAARSAAGSYRSSLVFWGLRSSLKLPFLTATAL